MAGEPTASVTVTDLTVGGMTCSACVRRVEKKLAEPEGVTATVNLATGLARVSPGAVDDPDAAVPQLAVAVFHAGRPGRGVERLVY